MVQRDFLIISDYVILTMSGLYNPDKGYFGKKRRAHEKATWWEK